MAVDATGNLLDYASTIGSVSGITNVFAPEGNSNALNIPNYSASLFSSGVFTVGSKGQVSFDYLFDGGAYQGEVAIFSINGLEQYASDISVFTQEVAQRALSNSTLGHVVISDSSEGARFSGKFPKDGNFQEGDYLGVKTFTMNPGDQFGIMLVPNATVREIANNLYFDGGKHPLFSLAFANPNSVFQVEQMADVTGNGSTFVFEDLGADGSTDRDYNDIIFQVRGAVGKAVRLDEVINPTLEWRDSPPGKALLAYVAPYDNPQTLQTVNFDFPATDQPLIGIIDTGFSANNPDIDYSRIIKGRDRVDGDDNPLLDSGTGNEHGTHILGIIAATRNNGIGIDGINDKAPIWLGRAVGSGQWADSLVEFVDYARQSGHPNALVNLSFDLTQVNPDGSVTTRYELTPEERSAIEYARQHNVFLVTSAGNDGGVMSVLGQASQEFDNIMTVGAADGLNRANYSSYGYGLDILAEGGTSENPILSTVGDGVGTMAGTSAAVAFVTGAISQVWAARPRLSYRQVINAVKLTATDLDKPNWDEETGAGLLNTEAAVSLADTIEPQTYYASATLIPESWSGAGKVISAERAASVQFSGKNYNWEWYTIKSGDTLSEIALRTMGNGTESYYNFIAQHNGIKNPSLIYPGQRIEIPKAASIDEFEGKRYEWVSYTVRPGDTLSEIALRTIGNGTEPYYNFIAQHNRINNPSLINAGQQIEIPIEVKNQESIPNPKLPGNPNSIDPIDSYSDNYRNGQVNPFAYRWQGQCTWYAYGRMLDTGLLPAGAKANGLFLGNAESWTREAKNAGLDVTSKPTPGVRGLVVWSPNAKGASRWGHVAFLEEVFTDGRIRISEANWTNQGISERILTPADYDGLSFVRLEGVAAKPILSSPPAQLGKQRQHIVQSGESVWGIAQTYLGDGKRWREIRKADGSQFTDVEAGKLQMGASVYLPVSYQSEPGKPIVIQSDNKPKQVTPISGDPADYEKLVWTIYDSQEWEKFGYKFDKKFDDNSGTGFYAVGLVPKDPYSGKPPVIVVRGTELNGNQVPKDVFDDLNPFGIGYKQFQSNKAKSFDGQTIEQWIAQVTSDLSKNPTLTRPDVIGHSLGAALAQQISSEFANKIGKTVTFNSPGISASKVQDFEKNRGSQNQVTHYIFSGDIVSMAGEAFLPGNVVLLSYRDNSLLDQINPFSEHLIGSNSTKDPNYKSNLQDFKEDKEKLTSESLSSPSFHYEDPDYFTFLLALATVSSTPALLSLVPGTQAIAGSLVETSEFLLKLTVSLSARGSTEAARKQYGPYIGLALKVGEAIGDASPQVLNAINAARNATSEWSSEAWNATTKWSSEAWRATSEWSSEAWNATTKWSSEAWNATTKWSSEAWNATTQWTADTWNDTYNWTSETWKNTTQWTADIWNKTTKTIVDLWDWIVRKG